jgi:hypothetical protein
MECLEAMILGGWVQASFSGKYPTFRISDETSGMSIHPNRDNRRPEPVG